MLGGGAVASSALLAACTGRRPGGDRADDEATAGRMTCRENPATGEMVSLLGYGMMRLPTVEEGASQGGDGQEIDQEMVNRQVDYAIEHGVNYFDTSPVYCRGLSEAATGTALSRHPRDRYLVATKVSNFDPSTWTRQASMRMVEDSFRYLRVDRIDYLLLHNVGRGGNAQETFNARYVDNGILDWLVGLKEEGRVGNLGFSFHGDVGVFKTLLDWHDEGRYHWDFAQIELNYLDWRYAKEINPNNTNAEFLYGELERRKIPAVVMEPLLGGRLANVPDNVVAKMKARSPEASVASWAFRFAGTPAGVLTVLSGMTYMEHLRENVATFSPLEPLTVEDRMFLQGIADDIYNLKTIPCNACDYCMPCPYGIDIPGVLTHYNKCIKEGNIPNTKRRDAEYRRARRAFLIGYDRSVPKLRQASHCIQCGRCVELCPQRIDIPGEMARIDGFAEALRTGKADI